MMASPNGNWITLHRGNNPTEILDGMTGKVVATLPTFLDLAYLPAFVPGQDVYLDASNVARQVKTGNPLDVAAYDINQQKTIATFRGHDRPIHSLAVSGGGKVMATGDDAGNVLLWDLGQLK